jgi:hypothetical protein
MPLRQANPSTIFLSSHRPLCVLFPAPSVVTSYRTAAAVSGGRRRAWPGCHGSCRGLQRPSAGACRPPGPPPPLLRRRRETKPPENASPSASSVLIRIRGFGRQFDKMGGVTCEPMTHVNSAFRDLSAGFQFEQCLGASVQTCFSFIWLKFGKL